MISHARNRPRNSWTILPLALLIVNVALGLAADGHGSPVAEFRMQESFAVTHPSQVVTFDLPRPVKAASYRLLDETGKEQPYQLIAGGKRLAFCADLPAAASRRFRLVQGVPQVTDGVTVDESNPVYIEISNGLTGVRVPKVYAPLTPLDLKSPFQGIRFRNGAWSPGGTPLILGDTPRIKRRQVGAASRPPSTP